jgi:AraC-like DNA-binding protein
LVLIQALRAAHRKSGRVGRRIITCAFDTQIGAALRLMHTESDHPLDVATLASEAGMSRSAFALRFKELVGGTPLEYLTRWRMHRASHLLRESDHNGFGCRAVGGLRFGRIISQSVQTHSGGRAWGVSANQCAYVNLCC